MGEYSPMWKWMTRWGTMSRETVDDAMAITERRTVAVSGKYALLHKYLENRYADIVVLTFGQIEDLMGSALPPLARTDAWWTVAETNVKDLRPSDAWTRAGRTATPNVRAETVIFERTPTTKRGLQ
jgi:hypothetical protein